MEEKSYTYSKCDRSENNLVIDSREPSDIFDKLKSIIEVNKIALPVGDYMYTNNGRIIAILERKTLSDYYASIKDKRLEVQKQELKELLKKGIGVGFIVEGIPDPSKKNETIALEASLRLLLDGMPMYRTNSLSDTIKLLLSLRRIYNRVSDYKIDNFLNIKYTDESKDRDLYRLRIEAWKKIPRIGNVRAAKNIEKCISIKSWLIKNIDTMDIDILVNILSTLPGVTKKTALKYIDSFKCYDEFFDAINEEKNIYRKLLS